MNLPIIKVMGYFLSPIVILVFFISEPSFIDIKIWKSLGSIILMLVLWITEVIPIYVTALLPLVLFPFLQLLSIEEVAVNYSNPIIFLFLGGFMIAKAIEKHNLHIRMANLILSLFSVQYLGLGILLTSAILSMWISNTATALILLPIIQNIITLLEKQKNQTISKSELQRYEILLLLLVAYGCNMGGMATIIGTPPNALYVAFIKEHYKISISFFNWAILGIPIILLILFIVYYFIKNFILKLNQFKIVLNQSILTRPSKKWSLEEKLTLTIFLITVLLWFFQPLLSKIFPYINDSNIAMLMAIALFFIPVDLFKGKFLMEWKDVQEMNQIWGILILFGGGLAISKLVQNSGLANFISEKFIWLKSLQNQIPEQAFLFLMIFLVVFFIIFFTEITSNTATTATFLSLIYPIYEQLFSNSFILLLAIPLTASCAFMLPIATPPNAIIFSTEKITIKDMAKAGFWLNITFTFLISVFIYLLYYMYQLLKS